MDGTGSIFLSYSFLISWIRVIIITIRVYLVRFVREKYEIGKMFRYKSCERYFAH